MSLLTSVYFTLYEQTSCARPLNVPVLFCLVFFACPLFQNSPPIRRTSPTRCVALRGKRAEFGPQLNTQKLHRIALTWLGRLGRRLRHWQDSKKAVCQHKTRAVEVFEAQTSPGCEHFAVSDNEEVRSGQGTRKSSAAHAQSQIFDYRLLHISQCKA